MIGNGSEEKVRPKTGAKEWGAGQRKSRFIFAAIFSKLLFFAFPRPQTFSVFFCWKE
jgi:hypothetical protein